MGEHLFLVGGWVGTQHIGQWAKSSEREIAH